MDDVGVLVSAEIPDLADLPDLPDFAEEEGGGEASVEAKVKARVSVDKWPGGLPKKKVIKIHQKNPKETPMECQSRINNKQ